MFEAHIINSGMSICSHRYRNYHGDKSLPELPLHVGRIESLNLVITHEIGNDKEEIQNTIMLSASLANALAESTTLRRLTIFLEVYPCDSEYDTVRLGRRYEKDVTRLLRCFEQLRGLEYVDIDIQGYREISLDGRNRERWSYEFSHRFSRLLRKLPNIMESRTRSRTRNKPKKIDVDLFRRYLAGHEKLFPGRQSVFGSTNPELGRDLLRDAWEACTRSDMEAYEKIFEATKNRWRALEKSRIEKMMDEFNQQASVVKPSID